MSEEARPTNETHTAPTKPILVLGATGKTGRRVVQRLVDQGVDARLGVRASEPPFDWERVETWEPALRGVDAVYVCYYPDIAVPGSLEAIRTLVNLAKRSGVRRLVLLSGRGEEEAERAEQIVQGSGLEWTIVRASWFMQNFSESYFLDGLRDGQLIVPAANVQEPFVDADDIADVAVKALLEDGHAGQLYEVTGPRLLSFREAVAEIAAATGREMTYLPVSAEAFSTALREQGAPEDVIWLLNYLFTTVLDGRNEQLTDGVQRALGRAPRDFADYARETAATGVWDAVVTEAMR